MSTKKARIAAGTLAVASIASIATAGAAVADNYKWDGKTTHYYGNKISVGAGWSGSYTLVNQTTGGREIFYCADPDAGGPSNGGTYSPGGQVDGQWITEKGNALPGYATNQIAYVLAKYGKTTNNERASAVEAAVYSLQALPGWQLDDGTGDMTASDPRAVKRMAEAGPGVHKLAVDMMMDARAYSTDSYKVAVTVPDNIKPGATYTVTGKLTNQAGRAIDGTAPTDGSYAGLKMTFKDNTGKTVTANIGKDGVATATFTAGNTAPTVTATADTYDTSVNWYKPSNPEAQRILVAGARMTVNGSDAGTLAPSTPTATTTTSKQFTTEATKLHDNIKVTGGVPGAAFSGTATLYGPFADKPVASDAPPAGAPKVGTVPFNGTYGADGTATVKTGEVEIKAPGYYVWVETLAPTANTEGFTEKFGVAEESSLFYKPTINTKVNDQKALVGETLTDTVALSGIEVLDAQGKDMVNTMTGTLSFAPAVDGACTKVDWTKAEKVAEIQPTKVDKDGTITGVGAYTVDREGCYSYSETLTTTRGGEEVSKVEHPVGQESQTSLASQPVISTQTSQQLAMPGASVIDTIKVAGTNGKEGTMDATLYGMATADATKGCAAITDEVWRKAIADGKVKPLATERIAVKGDGTYKTKPVVIKDLGCATWYESATFKTPGGDVKTETKYGVPSETTLVIKPQVSTVAHASSEFVDGTLTDDVKVSGTYGESGVVTGKLLGPIAPTADNTCEGLDWSKAPVAGTIPATKVKGDGVFTTAPIATKGAGCYTFVETLTMDKNKDVVYNTKPGEPTETKLIKMVPVKPAPAKPKPQAPVVNNPAPVQPAPVVHMQPEAPAPVVRARVNSGVAAADQNANLAGAAAGGLGLLGALSLGGYATRRRFNG